MPKFSAFSISDLMLKWQSLICLAFITYICHYYNIPVIASVNIIQ